MEKLLSKYKEINEKIDMLNIEKEEVRQEIMLKMKTDNLDKFENDTAKVIIKPAYFRKSFNSKDFKADNPFLYEQYVKETEIQENVNIKLQL